MRKRVLLLTLAILSAFGLNQVQAGGGPDAYGYIWLASTDAGGPAYNWIDIIGKPGTTQISGLADDNSVGPFSMGFDFHYYWSDYNEVKVGSNGWLGFNNIGNISHCFPTMPTPGGAGDNFVAPLMHDLNFAGGSYGRMFYWTNNVDSFIVTCDSCPRWVNATPDYEGVYTFQTIFTAVDSSITFQYKSMETTFNDQTGCAADVEVGIENVTGNLGLEVFNELLPPAGIAVKFYYPAVVTFQVPDVTPAWNANADNKGQFVFAGSFTDMMSNIANVGNTNVATTTNVAGKLSPLSITPIAWQDATTVPSLNAGASQTITFPSQANLTTAGQYYYEVTTTNGSDINPSNNSNTVEISAVENVGGVMGLTYATGNPPDGAVAWSGGGGNDGAGIYIVPPGYPAIIQSVDIFILGDDGDPQTPMLAGFDLNIIEEDVNGDPGAVLASVTVAATGITEDDWNNVPFPSTPQVNSGGFYVSWIMEDEGVALGTEAFGPISRRTYEILSGAWAPYRQSSVEDFLIRVNIDGLVGTEDALSNGMSLTAFPNPANAWVNVQYEISQNSTIQFSVTNMYGQQVFRKEHTNIPSGVYQFGFDGASLAPGVYFVNMETNGKKLTEKVVIAH